MYEEIEPSIWKPENEGDFIEGILVRVQENVGENKSMLYGLETSEGVKNIWGSAILLRPLLQPRPAIRFPGNVDTDDWKNTALSGRNKMRSVCRCHDAHPSQQ